MNAKAFKKMGLRQTERDIWSRPILFALKIKMFLKQSMKIN